MVSVLGLTDRFALEYHDTNSGDAISDNLRKYQEFFSSHALSSD